MRLNWSTSSPSSPATAAVMPRRRRRAPRRRARGGPPSSSLPLPVPRTTRTAVYVRPPSSKSSRTRARVLGLVDHRRHGPVVVVAGDAAVERERDGVDDRRLAGARVADERDELDVGEVDRRRVAERAEALQLQPQRPHRRRRLVEQLVEQRRTRSSSTPSCARYSSNRSWGLRAAWSRRAGASLGSGDVDAHLDDARAEQLAHVVGQPGPAVAAHDHPQPRVALDGQRGELVDRAAHACAAAGRPSSRTARTSAGTPGSR